MNTTAYYIYLFVYFLVLGLLTIRLKKYYRIHTLDLIIVSNGIVSFLALIFILLTSPLGHNFGLRADPSAIISLGVSFFYYQFKIARELRPQRPIAPTKDINNEKNIN